MSYSWFIVCYTRWCRIKGVITILLVAFSNPSRFSYNFYRIQVWAVEDLRGRILKKSVNGVKRLCLYV